MPSTDKQARDRLERAMRSIIDSAKDCEDAVDGYRFALETALAALHPEVTRTKIAARAAELLRAP